MPRAQPVLQTAGAMSREAIAWVEDDAEAFGARIVVERGKCTGCGVCVPLRCSQAIEVKDRSKKGITKQNGEIQMKTKIGLLFGIMLAAITLAGCGASGSKAEFVGKWSYDDQPGNIIEFNADGTGVLSGPNLSKPYTLTWKTSGGKVTISVNGGGETISEYNLSGSKLTIDTGGIKDNLTKVEN